MNLYDDNGNKITEAPLHNPNSAFWLVPKSGFPHCALVLEAGNATFDDETAYGKYVKKWLDHDRDFTTPAGDANKMFERYIVTSVGQENTKDLKVESEAMRASKAFFDMDLPKKTKFLGAFGVKMTEPDDKIIDQQLWKRITTDKDVRFTAGGPTNLEYFLSMVDGTEAENETKYLISVARRAGKITKAASGYRYDGVKLGPTLNDVTKYLDDAKNEKVRKNIEKELDIE